MRRRSRLLRIARWGGVVLCAFVAIASIASMWLTVVWNGGQPDRFSPYYDRNPDGGVEIGLGQGLFWLGWRPPITPQALQLSNQMKKAGVPPSGRGMPRPSGWTIQTHASYLFWWPQSGIILPIIVTINRAGRTTTNRWIQRVTVPLWLPLVLMALPTAFLWWRDRPSPPGHCACGYNLTGNVSGRCPECGEAVG